MASSRNYFLKVFSKLLHLCLWAEYFAFGFIWFFSFLTKLSFWMQCVPIADVNKRDLLLLTNVNLMGQQLLTLTSGACDANLVLEMQEVTSGWECLSSLPEAKEPGEDLQYNIEGLLCIQLCPFWINPSSLPVKNCVIMIETVLRRKI